MAPNFRFKLDELICFDPSFPAAALHFSQIQPKLQVDFLVAAAKSFVKFLADLAEFQSDFVVYEFLEALYDEPLIPKTAGSIALIIALYRVFAGTFAIHLQI